MFDELSEKVSGVFSKLRGRGVLSDADIKEGLRAMRRVLLVADVSIKLTREFLERVVQRLSGNVGIYGDTMRIAAEIPDPSRRDVLLRGVYRLWLEAHPESAAEFITRSRWPAEKLAVLSDLHIP